MGEIFEARTLLSHKVKLEENRAFSLYRLEGKILFFSYHSNINIELSDVKHAFELYERYSEGHIYKVLLSFGLYTTIDVDARKYAENKSMPTPAQAMVIANLAHRMIARFYELLRKDKHPLKYFRNSEDALNWLVNVVPSGND